MYILWIVNLLVNIFVYIICNVFNLEVNKIVNSLKISDMVCIWMFKLLIIIKESILIFFLVFLKSKWTDKHFWILKGYENCVCF